MQKFRFPDVLIDLKDFKLNSIIGEGGVGVVFNATDKKTKETVALKVVRMDASLSTAKGQQNIMRELTVPFKINFSGIVSLKGFRFPLVEEEKTPEKKLEITMKNKKNVDVKVDLSSAIFITEYMANGSVETIIQNYLTSHGKCIKNMNPTIRSKIIFGVSSIMEKIHEKKVIHRDLKLENIFLDDNLEPRIADFGLAKVVLDNTDMTLYVGTPICMAPELFMDTDETYSYPVDVYAFAFIIYKMFTNKVVFEDKKPLRSQQQYMMKISKNLRPIRPESIPDCYWDLIQLCWHQDPHTRPKFSDITKLLRNDKYAINEFGMKTDLDELHEYQDRIESEEIKLITPKPKSGHKKRKTIFIWTRH